MNKWIIAFIASIITIGVMTAVYAYSQEPETPQYTAPALSKYEVGPPDAAEILELVNAERAKHGVAPLVVDENVQKSAQLKANDMAENNYFDHIMPSTGKVLNDEMDALLVASCVDSSENINRLTGEDSYKTSQRVFDSWKGSKPHYEAILNPEYTGTGLAVTQGEPAYQVQHFCIAK